MINIDIKELAAGLKRPGPGPGQHANNEHQLIKARNLLSIRTEVCQRQRWLELARCTPFLSRAFKVCRQPIESLAGDRSKAVATSDQLAGGGGVFRGFSLIETILALAIVFFLLTGLAQVICYSLLLKQKGDLHQVSADLISRKLELLKSLAPENEALLPGLHQETIQEAESGRLFLLNWEVNQSQDGLKKIQVSLYPDPFGHRPPVRVCWLKSESLGF